MKGTLGSLGNKENVNGLWGWVGYNHVFEGQLPVYPLCIED